MDWTKLGTPSSKIMLQVKEGPEHLTSSIISSCNEHHTNSLLGSRKGTNGIQNLVKQYSCISADKDNMFEASYSENDTTDTRSHSNVSISSFNNNQELKVFKHKAVNSLIRNRIVALEKSINTNVGKKQNEEVNHTIKAVIKDGMTDEISPSVSYKWLQSVQNNIPTCNIRKLVQETKPTLNDFILPVVDTEIYERNSKSNIKVEPEQRVKPILRKQFSYTMDKKLHDETNEDDWKAVRDISTDASSSESGKQIEVLEETPSATQSILNFNESQNEDTSREQLSPVSSMYHQPINNTKMISYDHAKKVITQIEESEIDSCTSVISEFDSKTVQLILEYVGSDEYIRGNLFESFEQYVIGRRNELGYDTMIGYSDHDAERYSQVSDLSEVYDENSIVENKIAEYVEKKSRWDDSDYGFTAVYDSQSDRNSEYLSEEFDDRTVVEEEQYTYSPRYEYDDDYSIYNENFDQRNCGVPPLSATDYEYEYYKGHSENCDNYQREKYHLDGYESSDVGHWLEDEHYRTEAYDRRAPVSGVIDAQYYRL